MALKVNGASLEWRAYEYGIRRVRPDGVTETIAYENQDQQNAALRLSGGQPVFRAVYHTNWEDML